MFQIQVTAMVAAALPQVAAEVSAPLSRVNEIVIIGSNKGMLLKINNRVVWKQIKILQFVFFLLCQQMVRI